MLKKVYHFPFRKIHLIEQMAQAIFCGIPHDMNSQETITPSEHISKCGTK